MNYTLMILGMSVITVLIKASFFIIGDKLSFPPWLSLALSFVPVTVLTAIITPMILAPHGQGLELNIHNPQLIASVVAIIVSIAARKQLLTIGLALVTFFCWQYFMAV